jgi:ppGpp synthetase/RelA/SpoT-type nucleotidyltranferase
MHETTDSGAISKSQLDRLGSRLRNSAEPSDDDLVLLNRYRRGFLAVEGFVVGELRRISAFPIESRHKSIPSIVAKLRRRQPARLSAIQDMAGARIIVPYAKDQDEVVRRVTERFSEALVDDKRQNPSFGYRAVHVIVSQPLQFEIQVRTDWEHGWAQLSERLADRYGFQLKYGGGPEEIRTGLLELSEAFMAAQTCTAEIMTGKISIETTKELHEAYLRVSTALQRLVIE